MHVLFKRLRPSRPRQGNLNAWCFALLMQFMLPGCAQNVDSVEGSETHFLKACDASCASGLECVDGQCSLKCTNDEPCSDLNGSATCESQPSGVNACEVGCSKDADCTDVRPELWCNSGVCRGPLWHVNAEPDADTNDATNAASDDTNSVEPGDDCDDIGCPEPSSMFFQLPELGLGTARLEFMFNLDGSEFVRCATEFVDDALTNSSCETDAITPASLEPTCHGSVECPSGQLRFDVRPQSLEVTYWQGNGYQALPLELTWEEEQLNVGPTECNAVCSVAHTNVQLPSTKGLAACLNPEAACDFGLGCGDRASALANAPCGEPNTNVWSGTDCGYDVLIFEQYIESERAFYDRDTGAFVGFWHRSDTSAVECSGQVPFDCSEVAPDLVNICDPSDAGSNDAGSDIPSDTNDASVD